MKLWLWCAATILKSRWRSEYGFKVVSQCDVSLSSYCTVNCCESERNNLIGPLPTPIMKHFAKPLGYQAGYSGKLVVYKAFGESMLGVIIKLL